MTTVVVSPSNVADYQDGGGHFWVYLQYVLGFKALGCEVYWLENFHGSGDPHQDLLALEQFIERLRRFGLADNLLIHMPENELPFPDCVHGATISGKAAELVCRQADLLVNFAYTQNMQILSLFRKTALVDIDPGLLQFWISEQQISVGTHDLYFSTGETVGKAGGLIPDCGIAWHSIRPVVYIEAWPVIKQPDSTVLTTISGWWRGGVAGEWISNGAEINYENNKRVSFLEFVQLPAKTQQALELALCLGDGDSPENERHSQQQSIEQSRLTDYVSDDVDRAILESNGWRITQASEVAGNPQDYQHYIQNSRGEFSCAKPSCMKFQNAWVSDRSLCYLASGKPVIVQNTGASNFLPDANGMFRFVTFDDALAAIDAMNSNYELHCATARDLAETYFDSKKVLTELLAVSL